MPGTYPGFRWTTKPPLGYGLNRAHPLARGLAGAWLLNEGGGPAAADLSATAGPASLSAPAWSPGPYGTGLLFNGSTDQATTTLAAAALGGAYSLAVRARFDVTSGNPVVLSVGGNALLYAGAGSLRWQQDYGGFPFITSPTTLVAGQWVVVCVTSSGSAAGQTKVYVNGVQSDDGAAAGSLTASGQVASPVLTVGRQQGVNGARFFTGHVSWFHAWNRVLTGAEAASLYADPYATFQAPAARRFFAPAAAGGGSVTGTGSPALGKFAASGSGPVTGSGSGSPALGRFAASGSGGPAWPSSTGTGAAALGKFAASGSGATAAAGSGSPTLGRFAASGSGSASAAGSGSPALGKFTASGTGAVASAGSGGVALGKFTASGSGAVVTGISGSGTPALKKFAGSGSGAVSASGSGAPALGKFAASGSGAPASAASGAAALGKFTAAGSGSVLSGVAGSGSPSLGRFAASGSGGLVWPSNTGTGAATLLRFAAAGLGLVVAAGSGSPALGKFAASGTGSVVSGSVTGAGAATLGRFAASGSSAPATPPAYCPPYVAMRRRRQGLAALVPPYAPSNLREGVVAALKADAGVSALVAGRVYPGRLPQKAVFPAVTYQVISDPRDHDLDGPTRTAEARVQFAALSRAFTECYGLADAIKAALDGLGPTTLPGGVVVVECDLANETDGYEPPPDGSDRGTFRVTVDYLILYRH